MKLKQFIVDFIEKKGIQILLASIFEKIAGFVFVIVATHFLVKEEFGAITYANSLLDFLFPFVGFGIHMSLLRFGALSKSQVSKKQLLLFTLKKGTLFSVLLILIIFVLSEILTHNIQNSRVYLLILSVQLLGLFLYETVRIYAQLIHINKLFVRITVLKTGFQILFIIILTHYFKGIGYVVAMSIIPLIVGLYFVFKIGNLKYISLNKTDIEFGKYFNYGLQTSFSGVLSQLMYATDILLIGNLIRDESQLAQYKVSGVLPYSFLFIAVAFLKTHIVHIAHHSIENKEYIKHYYFNYLKIFSVISVLIVIFLFLFYQPILHLFGKSYTNDLGLMHIFTFGIIGAIILRIPLGNIMATVGWVKFNTMNALIIAFINVIVNYYAIKQYGILGAAVVTSCLLWLSGVFSLIGFFIYLKKKDKN